MEPRKHLYLDGLRGLAILLVMLVHNRYLGSGATQFPPALLEIIESGQYGVQLFFVVSAYTLMASYYSRQNEAFQTRNFFIRRFFRIVPMYYAAVFYFTFQNYVGFAFFTTGEAGHIPAGQLFSKLFFLNGLNPYWINNYVPGSWSIGIEMLFYLVLPLFCRWITNVNGAAVLFAGSWLCAAVLEQVLHNTFLHGNEYLFYYFPNQLPVFSLGMLAFFVVRDGLSNLKPPVLALLAFTTLVFSFTSVSRHISLGLGYFLLVVLLAKQPYRIVANGFLAAVGRVSFSLYLVHFAVMHWLVRLGLTDFVSVTGFGSDALNFSLRFLLLFAVAYAVSAVSYRWIEVPGQRLGQRLLMQLRNGQSSVNNDKALLPEAVRLSSSPPPSNPYR